MQLGELVKFCKNYYGDGCYSLILETEDGFVNYIDIISLDLDMTYLYTDNESNGNNTLHASFIVENFNEDSTLDVVFVEELENGELNYYGISSIEFNENLIYLCGVLINDEY